MEKCSVITKSGKSCSRDAVIEDMCKQHAQLNGVETPKNYGTVILDYQGEYQACPVKKHHTMGSIYPRNNVPKVLFEDEFGTLFKTCLDCRMFGRKSNNLLFEKRMNEAKEHNLNNNFIRYCRGKSHDLLSEYKREEVPKELFLKNPDNPKSSFFEECRDCRNHKASLNKERIYNKKLEAANMGKYFCTQCHYFKDPDEMALNLDGSMSIRCCGCKIIEKTRRLENKEMYYKVKLEFIFEHSVSCQRCECIFLKPPNDGYIPIKLKTYQENGYRYVNYDSMKYLASDFLLAVKDHLELRIIQLDHLTELEQRERGLLLSHESFLPKFQIVSRLSSEEAMRLEAAKCQHLCAKCHLKITIDREEGIVYNSRSWSEREKLEYVNSLKINGCSICNYSNADFIRFFDMDHLNPENKIRGISRMVKDNKYTMDKLINECQKCRILCKHCHIIHTSKQFQEKFS